MISITLINCKVKLEAMGIDMETSPELLSEKINEKITYLSWNYSVMEDILIITAEEELPDMSEFGDVVHNDNSMGR